MASELVGSLRAGVIRIAKRGLRSLLLCVLGSTEIADGALCASDRRSLDAQLFGLRRNLSFETIAGVDEFIDATLEGLHATSHVDHHLLEFFRNAASHRRGHAAREALVYLFP
jgi:hypothetical protein